MQELYLVSYTHECDVLTHKRELKAISFGEEFKKLKTLVGIVQEIEKQTTDRAVQVMSITSLHEIIDYAGENQISSNRNVSS